MKVFLFVATVSVFLRCQSHAYGQLVEFMNLSNWSQCSSMCWCATDNHSRIYGRCSVKKLDEALNFNLSRDLYSLSLENNGIRNIHSGSFRKLENLEFLSLENNSIEIIHEHAFQGLKSLRVLDLRYNNLKEWKDDPAKDIPSLEILKVNGNNDWIPSQQFLNLPMLKGVYGVTWSQHCFACDLIKTLENETLSIDDEGEGEEENSGDGYSGESENEDIPCHVTLKEIYFYPSEVKYGVSARFVKQGFSPQCFCNPFSDCFKNDVTVTFLRQLYNIPRTLFLSQYALGALTIFLNLLVLFVIITSRILRNKTSFILVGSMALSDLLIGVYSVAIAKHNLFSDSDKVIPRVIMEDDSSICDYIGMVFTTGQVTAVGNSLLLTLERYLVIVYFQRCHHRFKKKTLLAILFLVWMSAVIFASLPLLGLKTLKYLKWFQCTMPFHTGKGFLETSDVTLSISAIFVFLYLISLGLYVLIFCYVRKSSLRFGIKREARVARKIAMLVSSNFILFTLPTVLLLVYVYSFSDFLLSDMVRSFSSMRSLLIVGGWLPVTCFSLNSLVNPFLYPFRHSRFKRELRSFYSDIRNRFSHTFHPLVVTAQQISLRTSALSNHIRLHFHSIPARGDGETSLRVELQLRRQPGRRASI